MSKQDRIPSIYLIGNRRLSVIHARIRNNCSNLNNDFFLNNLKLSSICDCRNGVENAEHYFLTLESRLFNQQGFYIL